MLVHPFLEIYVEGRRLPLIIQQLNSVHFQKISRRPFQDPAAVGDSHQIPWVQRIQENPCAPPDQFRVVFYVKIYRSPAVDIIDIQPLHPDAGPVNADDMGIESGAQALLRGGAASGEKGGSRQSGAVQD
jgi:hypothetical protein